MWHFIAKAKHSRICGRWGSTNGLAVRVQYPRKEETYRFPSLLSDTLLCGIFIIALPDSHMTCMALRLCDCVEGAVLTHNAQAHINNNRWSSGLTWSAGAIGLN